ncbi:unnamed protein product [Cochlearia groenlandica]
MASFNSVKDAVKLFDSGGFSRGRHMDNKQEHGLLVEDTNLCLWNNQVHKLKEKIEIAEKIKIDALLELEETKKTVKHLNHKLGITRNEKALDSNVTVVTLEHSMRNEKPVDMSKNVRVVTWELGFAKESLQRVAEEESELCTLMESLRLELRNVKKEHSKLKENEQRERDQAIEQLKKETEVAKTELLLLEEELKIALFEAEEAKAAEKQAMKRINVAETEAELTETEALKAFRDETMKKVEMKLKRRRKAAKRILAETKMCGKPLPSTKEVNKSKLRSSSKEGCLVKC